MSFLLNEFITIPFKEFYRYRELIAYLVKSEFKQKHFLTTLGPIWWIIEPLLTALTFIFLVTIVKAITFEEHYVMSILISVLTWRWFAKSVGSAPNMLLEFRRQLKRTNLSVLPMIFSNILFELMIFTFSLVIIFIGLIIDEIDFTLNILYLPLIILLQLTMILAIVPHLAIRGLFFRDLSRMIPIILGIWFFVSPSIYSEKLIPEQFIFLYQLNPFAIILPAWRDVLILGETPDLIGLGIWFIVFFPIALWGLRNIDRNRSSFFKRL